MPSNAYIKAAKQANRQPVTLMSVESINAIIGEYSTADQWAGSVELTGVSTTEISGIATVESEVTIGSIEISEGTNHGINTAPFDCNIYKYRANVMWLSEFGPFPALQFQVYAGTTPSSATLRGASDPTMVTGQWISTFNAYFGVVDFTFRNTLIQLDAGEKIYHWGNPNLHDFAKNSLLANGQTGFKILPGYTWEGNQIKDITPTGAIDRPTLTVLKRSATLTTATIDLGEIPTIPSRFQIDDVRPANTALTVTAYAGNVDPPTINVGTVSDGYPIGTTGYRYYRFRVDYSMTGGDRAEVKEIRIIGGNSQFKHISTHAGEPIATAIAGLTDKAVSSLSSKIDLVKFSSTGEVSVKLHWTREIGDLLATGYLKNKTVKIRDGFVGLPEPDFETVFAGTWHDYTADHAKKIITVKLQNVLKRISKRKLPVAGANPVTGVKTTTPLTWAGVNGIQIMLDMLDLLGVPDRELDRAEFESIRDGVRLGWDLTRTIREPVEASKLLAELSVTMGVFLSPQPTGLLKPIVYDASQPAVATLDARDMTFSAISGGQKELFTRQKIYYNASTDKPSSAEDYSNLLFLQNKPAEDNRNEIAEREWLDKWGINATIAASIAYRFDRWFADPHYSVSVKQVPPHLLGIMPGQIVTVDNLELPTAAANYGDLSAGAKFLVMARNHDPQTGGLKLDLYDVQTAGAPGAGVVGTDMIIGGDDNPAGSGNIYTVAGGVGPYAWQTTLGALSASSGSSIDLDVTGLAGAGTITVSDPTGTVIRRFNCGAIATETVSGVVLDLGAGKYDVYHSLTNDFSTADLVITTDSGQYTAPEGGGYYWTRPLQGPLSVSILAATRDILSGDLNPSLKNRIDLIDAPDIGLIDQQLSLSVSLGNLAGSISATVYVQPAAPVAGVSGIPNPIPYNARWYDSDDSNHPYIWQGGAWLDLNDPRVGANKADITTLKVTVDDPATGVSATATALGVLDTTVTGTNGIASRVNTLESQITSPDSTTAAKLVEIDTALVTLDDANVSSRKQLEAKFTANAEAVLEGVLSADDQGALQRESKAIFTAEQTARANADSALATDITTLQASVAGNGAAIQTEQTARANADSAIATDITTLQASVAGNGAAIQTEQTARADADSAEAAARQTIQATIDDPATGLVAAHAAVQVQASSLATLDGMLKASYEVKTDVNGRVAGFGLINDGAVSEFGILADKFWIADPAAPGTPQTFPFIVSGGKVYISTAFIEDATIDSAKIKGLAADKITAGIITAAIQMLSAQITGGVVETSSSHLANGRVFMSGQTNNLQVLDTNGVVRVKLGKLA